jgi:hypothetical protein
VRRSILAAIASALCLVGVLCVPAQAASRAPHGGLAFKIEVNSWGSLCDDASPHVCARDPSDGGPGTLIKMSTYSGDNAMQWQPKLASLCGGIVGHNCPNQALAQRYPNDPIYYFVNRGSGDCLGANQNTGWGVQMKTCDDTDTLFIYNVADNGCAGSYCYTVSVRFGLTFTNGIAWLCGYNTSNFSGALITSSCPSPGSPRWN